MDESEKSFTFDNAQFNTLTTPTGLEIRISPNSFVDMNGVPVSTNIKLDVTEILTPVAMILRGKPTVSNGLPLESGGEFFIQAFSGNQRLRLAPGTSIGLKLPQSGYTQTGMSVFNGIKDNVTGVVNWQLNNNQGVRVIPADTLANGGTAAYVMFTDSIEWINCDRFINDPKISFTANAGNCPNRDSTVVFVHLTGRNSVLQLPLSGADYKSDFLIAANATIVAVCSNNGNFYSSVVTLSLQHGQSTTLDFKPTNYEALKTRLKQLR